MNGTRRNQNLCDKSQLHWRDERMQGQPQIFILVVALLKFPKTYQQPQPREFPVMQHTDQKRKQMYRTTKGNYILSWKNAGVRANFYCPAALGPGFY